MCSTELAVITKAALGPLIMGACHLQSPAGPSVRATEATITGRRLGSATGHAH